MINYSYNVLICRPTFVLHVLNFTVNDHFLSVISTLCCVFLQFSVPPLFSLVSLFILLFSKREYSSTRYSEIPLKDAVIKKINSLLFTRIIQNFKDESDLRNYESYLSSDEKKSLKKDITSSSSYICGAMNVTETRKMVQAFHLQNV